MSFDVQISQSTAVTVLLPSHNGMPYLRQAVESILAQTYRNFELLLIDDGSTDDTPLYASQLDDPRLRYIRLEKVGLANALNRGLKLARGFLIARMDADDIATPERLVAQYMQFSADAELVLASVGYLVIDAQDRVLRSYRPRSSDAALRFALLFSPPLLHPGVMFRREAALAAGGYDATFSVTEDYDLWTRLASLGRITNLPEILMRYRDHGQKVSRLKQVYQRKQTTVIAARYASTVLGSARSRDWDLLHKAITGSTSIRYGFREVRAFRRAAKEFQRTQSPDLQLRDEIAKWQSHLRWRLLAQAERSWRNPRIALPLVACALQCGMLRALKGRATSLRSYAPDAVYRRFKER